jgi:hypothetical protein
MLPERPADDDVPLDCDPEGTVDGPRLSNEAKGVDPRCHVRKDPIVVVCKERVLTVSIDGWQPERKIDDLLDLLDLLVFLVLLVLFV